MHRNVNVSGAPLAGDAILKSFRLVSNSPSWSLDRMRESWLQNFSDLSSRITVSEWRRRSKELDNSMEVIKRRSAKKSVRGRNPEDVLVTTYHRRSIPLSFNKPNK